MTQGRQIGTSRYDKEHYCERCGEWYDKSIGIRCPYSHKMRIVPRLKKYNPLRWRGKRYSS